MDAARENERNDTNRRNELMAIAAVLLLALVMRGVILFTGQRYLRSDEAVVGMMAKHIVTRGERPLFLYGQAYGGGHAIVAYVAAPLFAVFGRSAILLTGISATVSMLNIWLLWLILRPYFDKAVAVAASALYAFSPPVVYGSFLVNGGTESFCLALLGLMFFLQAYWREERPGVNALLAGIFGGLAYYAMDYTLVYPIAFGLLWLAAGRENKWRCLGLLVLGFIVGCTPLIVYNLTHDLAHLRRMFSGGAATPFLVHFFGALWHAVTRGLAVFFSGEIDDYRPGQGAGPGAWIHAAAAVISVLVLLWGERDKLAHAAKRFSLSGKDSVRLSPTLIPAVFVVLYMIMYATAKFSGELFRTPRYFLPLCPFVSIAIAAAAIRRRPGRLRAVGYALVGFLLLHGAFLSLGFGLRPWHEEHRIRTSGREIKRLAAWLEENDIRTAMAPYEIQYRLMFEADERILVSSHGISLLPRYDYYGKEFMRRVQEGEKFAVIVRHDFRFMELGKRNAAGDSRATAFRASLRRAGFSEQAHDLNLQEFMVFYPLTARLFIGP